MPKPKDYAKPRSCSRAPVDGELAMAGTATLAGPGGMSLRDWFAGLAMQAMLANHSTCGIISREFQNAASKVLAPGNAFDDALSVIAYESADAMIRRRAMPTRRRR